MFTVLSVSACAADAVDDGSSDNADETRRADDYEFDGRLQVFAQGQVDPQPAQVRGTFQMDRLAQERLREPDDRLAIRDLRFELALAQEGTRSEYELESEATQAARREEAFAQISQIDSDRIEVILEQDVRLTGGADQTVLQVEGEQVEGERVRLRLLVGCDRQETDQTSQITGCRLEDRSGFDYIDRDADRTRTEERDRAIQADQFDLRQVAQQSE
jgi:hypothetical protein